MYYLNIQTLTERHKLINNVNRVLYCSLEKHINKKTLNNKISQMINVSYKDNPVWKTRKKYDKMGQAFLSSITQKEYALFWNGT